MNHFALFSLVYSGALVVFCVFVKKTNYKPRHDLLHLRVVFVADCKNLLDASSRLLQVPLVQVLASAICLGVWLIGNLFLSLLGELLPLFEVPEHLLETGLVDLFTGEKGIPGFEERDANDFDEALLALRNDCGLISRSTWWWSVLCSTRVSLTKKLFHHQ